jgi:hypothetical protein
MKYRMHKRVETKPDGRTIYYYTFEPVEEQERETPAEPDPEMLATLKATTRGLKQLDIAPQRPKRYAPVLNSTPKKSSEKELPIVDRQTTVASRAAVL